MSLANGNLPAMQFDLVLRTFIDFFEREKIRYAVIGGLAVHAWGRVRPTNDADFAVSSSDRQYVIEFAESLGYATTNSSEGYSNHQHADPEWGHVDFMYLRGATTARVLGAVIMKELLPEHPVAVASPEHLAMMKALAMKNFPHRALYEGEDVYILLKVPGIDKAAIREYFESVGMLGMLDAIEKLD
jgi:hypothetical protein